MWIDKTKMIDAINDEIFTIPDCEPCDKAFEELFGKLGHIIASMDEEDVDALKKEIEDLKEENRILKQIIFQSGVIYRGDDI